MRLGRIGIALLAVATLWSGGLRDASAQGAAEETTAPPPATSEEAPASAAGAVPPPVSAEEPSSITAQQPVPSPVAAPTDSPSPSARTRPRRAGIFGLGFGVGSSTGPSGEVFGIGGGVEVTLGFKAHRVSIEVHTGVGYAAEPQLDQLRASKTRGHFGAHAAIVRLDLSPTSLVGFSIFGGAASASVPLLAVGMTGGRASRVVGNGVTMGGGLSYPLAKYLELGVDASLYFIRWDLPEGPYASMVEAVDETHARYTASTEDVSAIPWRLTASLRVIAF